MLSRNKSKEGMTSVSPLKFLTYFTISYDLDIGSKEDHQELYSKDQRNSRLALPLVNTLRSLLNSQLSDEVRKVLTILNFKPKMDSSEIIIAFLS